MTKDEKLKEKHIEDFPSVEITVRAYNTMPGKDGVGILTFTTFPTEVCDGPRSSEIDKNGLPINLIGDVSGGLGSVVISANKKNPDGEYYFMIRHKDLWEAITKAVGEQKETL